MNIESGWLIETNVNGYAEWLKLDSPMYVRWEWTTDSFEALRFARKIDAEIMITKLKVLGVVSDFYENPIATEHIWSEE